MAQIEYDESGATFSYFLLSAFAFLLIPLTYILWPRRKAIQDDESIARLCRCDGCVRKSHKKDTKKPREQLWRKVRYTCIAIGWILFVVMFYRTFTMELESIEYDPYEILEISRGADMSEIRRQYRKLSLRYHPDKDTGNQDKFMKIAKAYEALTDEESRKNWEEYGNPDGPRATSFGIALPSWIVSQESSIWVLVVYVGVFMVALPTAVGLWWYRSIKYSTANVLLDTQKLFLYCLNRRGAVDVKTLIMILTSAFEFSSRHGSKIKERPTDDEVLSKIITTSLPYCNMKVQQQPYSAPYARKCRALMHAYLTHVPLPGPLHEDLLQILSISPMLLQELLSVLRELTIFAMIYPKKVVMPSVDTFENVMKLSAMIVQCLWENQSPLLQLPHLLPEQLKHFHTKKRNISSIEGFAALPKKQRRQLLKTLTDTEYNNVLAVLSSYPHLTITVDVKVLDDEEEKRITVGSVVTVGVEITRNPMMEYEDDEDAMAEEDVMANEVETIPAPLEQENEDKKVTKVTKAWEKPKRRKKGATKATPKSKTKKKSQAKQSPQNKESESEHSEDEHDNVPASNERKSEEHSNHVRQRGVSNVKPSSSPAQAKESTRVAEEESNGEHSEDDDDEKEWNELQKEMKQKNASKINYQSTSWPVHAPFYPEEKQEVWWVYVCDRKRKTMIACPERVVGVRETEKTQVQFHAPPKPGIYHFSVVVKSDSYLDCVKEHPLKLKVDEAKEMVTSQWKDLEEEEAEEEAFEDSDQEGMSDSDEDDRSSTSD